MVCIKILCLDQATKITGYSVWENKELLEYNILESDSDEKNPTERMFQMYFKIKDLIGKIKPDFVCFEDVQFQRNYNTYKQLSQMQGIVMSTLFEKDLQFIIVEPTVWKSYCKIKGKKRIEQKENTIKMVKDKFGIQAEEDIADAIGIGLYCVNKIALQK